MVQQHEWVENYLESEAVLKCLNPLGPWDTNVAIRAFQTFGWDDATVAGSDLTFTHTLSAVAIRYDGNVLAINFGNGRLSEALPDLFLAVTGLGWKIAEVYHSAQSMSALLVDIGTAIPAHMKFDVSAAKAVTEVAAFAESASLVKRGREALKSDGLGDSLDPILAEFESMSPSVLEGSVSAAVPTTTPQQSGFLLDDIDDHVDDHKEEVAFVHASHSKNVTPGPVHVSMPAHEADGLVFNSGMRDLMIEEHSRSQATLIIENEHLRDSLSIANEQLEAAQDSVRRLVAEQEHSHAPWLEPEVPTSVADVDVDADIFKGVSMNSFVDVVRVGVSAFCFDSPDAPASDDDVKRIADDLSTDTVIHIRPGSIAESVRWDVFGDVTSQFPWSAQKLAALMGFDAEHCALVASVFLELTEKVAHAQLRDFLQICQAAGYNRHDGVHFLVDSAVTPSMKILFSRLGSDDLSYFVEEISLRLSGLALCPVGLAFVDVRSSEQELSAEMNDAFSLTEVLQSSKARLFVIHVDVLDGLFVTWVVDLLRSVALSYSMTQRYSTEIIEVPVEVVTPAQQIDQAKVDKKQQTLVEVTAAVGDLVSQLRRLGVTV